MNRTRLAAARLWASDRLPYFSAGLFALTPVSSPGLGTFAVDRRWRVYIDPDVLEAWTVPQAGSVLVHELYHVLREHTARGAELGVGPENARAWNVCCDAEINDDLVAAGLDLPDPVLPRTLGQPDGQLAETYYAALPVVDAPDCGSGAHGHARPWELPDTSGIDGDVAAVVRRQVAHDVRAARKRGRLPLGVDRWADAELEPVVDWRRALGGEVRRAVRHVCGRVDYSYRRPSRRPSTDVVLPSFARPMPAVAVVVDTSASMRGDDLERALAEVDGIISRVGLRATGVPVLACDAAVHVVTKVMSASRVRLAGGGGTDMGVGIDAAMRLRPRPEVVVVLTDGHTPWPASAPPARVVVGLLAGAVPVPDWARPVVIE